MRISKIYKSKSKYLLKERSPLKPFSMMIVHSLSDLPESAQNCVLAIGNFDGVHKGHQALLAQAKSIAEKLNKPFGILTFEPHPRSLMRPDDPPSRITPPALKARRLEKCGADILFSLTFDWDFASQPPERFIESVFKDSINPAHIVVGHDFRFGQLRKGSPDTLKDHGYPVTIISEIIDSAGEAYSSSRIRTALRHGEIDQANALLGWDWEINGTVIHGDKRGREIGFPTANIALEKTVHPAYGVYATWVKLADSGEDAPWLPAATNIGIRPMFESEKCLVEAYIFDFKEEIYDQVLRIRPVKRLRGEAKFDSLDALISQIDDDCNNIKSILSTAK